MTFSTQRSPDLINFPPNFSNLSSNFTEKCPPPAEDKSSLANSENCDLCLWSVGSDMATGGNKKQFCGYGGVGGGELKILILGTKYSKTGLPPNLEAFKAKQRVK